MKKIFFKTGLSLTELLIAAVIMIILIAPSIEVMSKMFIVQANLTNDIETKQDKISLTERITSEIREATYIYPSASTLKIAVNGASADVVIGTEALAVLVPMFDSDGDILQPSTNITSFKGIAFSIIPKSDWDGSNSDKYVLIETNYNVNLAVDPQDQLLILATKPTDWSSAQSYILTDEMQPAIFENMGSKAFNINGDFITFGFIPNPKGTYFPSSAGSQTLKDIPYITSVTIKNARS